MKEIKGLVPKCTDGCSNLNKLAILREAAAFISEMQAKLGASAVPLASPITDDEKLQHQLLQIQGQESLIRQQQELIAALQNELSGNVESQMMTHLSDSGSETFGTTDNESNDEFWSSATFDHKAVAMKTEESDY